MEKKTHNDWKLTILFFVLFLVLALLNTMLISCESALGVRAQPPYFSEDIPGLYKILESIDCYHCNAKFSQDNNYIYLVYNNNCYEESDNRELQKINIVNGMITEFDYLKLPNTGNGKYTFNGFYVINENTIIQEDDYRNEQNKSIPVYTNITLGNDIFIGKSEEVPYGIFIGFQSTLSRNYFINRQDDYNTPYIILNLFENEEILLELPEEIKNITGKYVSYGFGRTESELFFAGEEEDTKDRHFFFYDFIEKKITAHFVIHEPEKGKFPWFPTDSLISPDGKMLAGGAWFSGLWLLDLESFEFIKVFSLKWIRSISEGSVPDLQLNLSDWSWDSKKLVMRVGDGFYVLDVEEYLASNPERMKAEIIE